MAQPIESGIESPLSSSPGEPTPGEVGADFSEAEGWFARAGALPKTLYLSLHALCLVALWNGPSPGDLALCAGMFSVRMFGITGGYHRYFSHKSFKTSRVFQFVLALLGLTATQKGPLWWASHHRHHHKYSDQPGIDVHSPKEGFLHSHQGWIFNGRWDGTDVEQVDDLARYPELMWINQWHIVGPVMLGVICFAIGGWSGVLWGLVVSTVLLWHATYSINSLAHVWGSRRYRTKDTSRNNWMLALLTFGEGWHNNHHHYCASARQGFYWWEVDVTYYILRVLSALGLIWDLREPPSHILRANRVR